MWDAKKDVCYVTLYPYAIYITANHRLGWSPKMSVARPSKGQQNAVGFYKLTIVLRCK